MKTLSQPPVDRSFAADFAAREAEPERVSHREAFALWILGSAVIWLMLFTIAAYLTR